MFRSKLILLLVLALLTMVVIAGCGQEEAPEPKPTEGEQKTQLEGTIAVAGSSSVAPLAEVLAEAFMAEHPGVRIDVESIGSSAGIKAAIDGTADIGTSSRELKDEEAPQVYRIQVCADGIAIVVHPQNEIANLTKEQVRKIYTGEITNWKDVGGSDAAIAVITREEGSGTRGAFEKIVMGKDAEILKGAIVQPKTGAVRAAVAGNPDGIGYVSMGALDDTVKALDIDGIAATVNNIQAGKYPIARPFLFVTKEEPTGLAKEFIDFCLGSEGQAVVAKDFIPLQ
jgi:phosphate transport system substrate-binding protein